MAKTLACIPLIGGAWLTSAWTLMLVVGVAHADWAPSLPTIGYRTALVIAVLYGISSLITAIIVAMIKELK